jgi:hypothetical protein
LNPACFVMSYNLFLPAILLFKFLSALLRSFDFKQNRSGFLSLVHGRRDLILPVHFFSSFQNGAVQHNSTHIVERSLRTLTMLVKVGRCLFQED